MNARAALQNGARASAIKPNNKGHSKNSRAEAGKGTYTQFEPARTYTQIYNLNRVEEDRTFGRSQVAWDGRSCVRLGAFVVGSSGVL